MSFSEDAGGFRHPEMSVLRMTDGVLLFFRYGFRVPFNAFRYIHIFRYRRREALFRPKDRLEGIRHEPERIGADGHAGCRNIRDLKSKIALMTL